MVLHFISLTTFLWASSTEHRTTKSKKSIFVIVPVIATDYN